MASWKHPDIATANAKVTTLEARSADLHVAGGGVSEVLGMPGAGAMAWPAAIVLKLLGSHAPGLPRAESGKA